MNPDLGYLLRCQAHQWDLSLSQAEFAYNSSLNRSSENAPLELAKSSIPHLLNQSSIPYHVQQSAKANFMSII